MSRDGRLLLSLTKLDEVVPQRIEGSVVVAHCLLFSCAFAIGGRGRGGYVVVLVRGAGDACGRRLGFCTRGESLCYGFEGQSRKVLINQLGA